MGHVGTMTFFARSTTSRRSTPRAILVWPKPSTWFALHRRDDGRWALPYTYKGKTYFQMEPVGRPSRWNTLRALRVLKWWNQT
jgi:hypothetical protein